MATLHLFICLLFFFTLVNTNRCFAARTLLDASPIHNDDHENSQRELHKLVFLMRDVLNVTHQTSQKPSAAKGTGQNIPFAKPVGFFPPNGGIPLPQQPNPTITSTELPTPTTLDLSSFSMLFPSSATSQELEFGSVTTVGEDLFQGYGASTTSTDSYGPMLVVIGRSKGVFVASSDSGDSHMIAMTAYLSGETKGDSIDGLSFFGMHNSSFEHESHVAVIGGSGKYVDANGYAVIKPVELVGANSIKKLLLFNVYLS